MKETPKAPDEARRMQLARHYLNTRNTIKNGRYGKIYNDNGYLDAPKQNMGDADAELYTKREPGELVQT